MNLASAGGYNYSPDTFRVRVVEYVNQTLLEKLNPYSITSKQSPVKEFLEEIHSKNLTVDIGNSFKFQVPACFNIIVNKCSSRKDFIEKALDERKESYLIKTRSKLAELDQV